MLVPTMSRRMCHTLKVRTSTACQFQGSGDASSSCRLLPTVSINQQRLVSTAPQLTKLDNTMTPADIRDKLLAPSFPIEKMTELLDHDNHQMRAEFRKFISEPVMVPRYNISLEEERELALRRLQRICDNKFISVLDFWNNPLRVFAAHELAAIIDPAMTTKMTVQFNLFGGTVLKLGTERHHKELLRESIISMTSAALG